MYVLNILISYYIMYYKYFRITSNNSTGTLIGNNHGKMNLISIISALSSLFYFLLPKMCSTTHNFTFSKKSMRVCVYARVLDIYYFKCMSNHTHFYSSKMLYHHIFISLFDVIF